MSIVKLIEPSVLAVTVEEVTAHTLPSYDGDSALIEQYIKAMTAHGQKMTGRQFVETSFRKDVDSPRADIIPLLPDLQSISKIEYTGSDGEQTEIPEDEYSVKIFGSMGYVVPKKSWPGQSISIYFNAGWPVVDGKSTTPEDIKVWIMIRVAGMYEQRENFIFSKGGRFGLAPMPKSFCDHLLDCYIVPGLGAGI